LVSKVEAGVPQSLVTSTDGQLLLTLPGDAVTELCTGLPS